VSRSFPAYVTECVFNVINTRKYTAECSTVWAKHRGEAATVGPFTFNDLTEVQTQLSELSV